MLTLLQFVQELAELLLSLCELALTSTPHIIIHMHMEHLFECARSVLLSPCQ
jgi:hypothetical protein